MTRIAPGLAGAVVRHSNEVFVESDGQKRVGVKITVSPEIFEQYRSGYRCIRCHAVQDEPFPEVCQEVYKDRPHPEPCMCGHCRCGFQMRAKQMERLTFEFQGEENLWPDRDDDEERARFELEKQGVWLPPGA